jgi:O-acetylhomoserine (thiol)-lyase
MPGFATLAVNGPRDDRDPHHSLRYPLYDSVAFEFGSAKEIENAFLGRATSHSYSRTSNPTVTDFEKRIALLSGAQGVVAVSSGMAAIANVFLALAGQGDNIVTTKYLFGNTYSLFTRTLARWGLEVRFADLSNQAEVSSLIDGNTRAVFAESIANPQMVVFDLEELARTAHVKGVPLVVDSTVSTPYLFRGKDHGADIEVVSSTKYISGGATVVGGVILDNGIFNWKQNPHLAEDAAKFGPLAFYIRLRREVYRNVGACMAPHSAWLQTLGLETLQLRIDRSCGNTLIVAKYLENHPKVKAAYYPGLENSPWHSVAARLFPRGCGGLLAFRLESREASFRFIDALKLVHRATNLSDNKTLAIHPASTIYCDYTPEDREVFAVPDTLIRLSVGIEDAPDIVADLEQALEA